MLKYAITDPKFYPNFKQAFEKYHRLKSADFILLRDKISSNYSNLAREFLELKNFYNAKFILHNEIDLAISLNANGVHLSSDNIENLQFIPKNIYKIASTHNEKEIEQAIKFGADAITISPVFDTPNKPQAMGISHFKKLCSLANCQIFALGGILHDYQISLCQKAGASGFASIRYFTQ